MISGLPPAAAAGAAAFARAAARISLVETGAAGAAGGEVVPASPAGAEVSATGESAAAGALSPDGAAAVLARIFARMSFVEGFGSVIQRYQCLDSDTSNKPLIEYLPPNLQ
jgi:hypothetical protein